MKKINIIQKNSEYSRLIQKGMKVYSKNITFFYESTDDLYHFGFSIGKKIGNAVTRNKIKRRIKNILDQKDFENSFNCIIMVRKGITELSFMEIENEINYLLKKSKLLKGEQNENK